MESKKINISKNERRGERVDDQSLFQFQLSDAQKFSIQSLQIFGYTLKFIRQNEDKYIPVLSFNDSFAIIDDDGEIHINADIQVRR